MALDPPVSYLAKAHLTPSTAENIQIEITVPPFTVEKYKVELLILTIYSVFLIKVFFSICLHLPSLSGLLIAMVVSLLFLLLLRFTAPVMVWVLIIGVLGAGAYGKLSAGVLPTTNAFFRV